MTDLIGPELDAAVARAEMVVIDPEWIDVTTFADLAKGERRLVQGVPAQPPAYSTDWALGGPLIERERIAIYELPHGTGQWIAGYRICAVAHGIEDWARDPASIECDYEQCGPTPLIAAMRAYVASKEQR